MSGLNDNPQAPEKKSTRVRVRTSLRRREPSPPRLTRGQVVVILFLAAGVGVLLGLGLARGVNKALRVSRERERIVRAQFLATAISPRPTPSATPSVGAS